MNNLFEFAIYMLICYLSNWFYIIKSRILLLQNTWEERLGLCSSVLHSILHNYSKNRTYQCFPPLAHMKAIPQNHLAKYLPTFVKCKNRLHDNKKKLARRNYSKIMNFLNNREGSPIIPHSKFSAFQSDKNNKKV